MDEVQWLTYDLFAGRIGERFEVSADSIPAVTMTLAQVTQSTEPGGSGPRGEDRLQFSLEFAAAPEVSLPQATYQVCHADLGALEIFLVPIRPEGDESRYEAAFA